MEELYTKLRLEFTDVRAGQRHPQLTVGPHGTETHRNAWRSSFNTALNELNKELGLGWMSCISVTFEELSVSEPPPDVHDIIPGEAIDLIRERYAAATKPDERRITGAAVLPRTNMTLDEAREKLNGMHFAKESLSKTERDVLRIAEGLLRLVDPESYGIDPDEIYG